MTHGNWRYVLATLLIAGCGHPVTHPAPPVRPLACHVAPPEVVEDATGAGRLRAAWRAAIATEMRTYDEVMAAVRPAYEGFVWFQGKRHGPVTGLVREDTVDGALVHQLQLGGVINTGIWIAARTPRQPGAFVIQLPPPSSGGSSYAIECSDCIDLQATSLSLTPYMRFDDRTMTLLESTGKRVPVEARVELRQLPPAQIDLHAVRALYPMLAESAVKDHAVVVTPFTDVWIAVERPPEVDPGHSSCESVLTKPPTIRVDTRCLADWQVQFESTAVTTTCCTQPRYHGPSRSGYYTEDCVRSP